MEFMKRSTRKLNNLAWSRLAAFLLVMLVCAIPVSAQGQTATVRGDPGDLEIRSGEVVTLTIVLVEAEDVYGIDVRATFDPQMIEVVDADPAKDGVQLAPGAFPQPDFVARNIADNQAGTLRYVVTQVNPTEPASGTGIVFIAQIRGKAPGGTVLTLGPVEMADRVGQLLPVAVQEVSIRIAAEEEASAPNPEPTSAAMLPATTEPATPDASAAASQSTGPSPVFPGGLPCAGGALGLPVGLLALAGWGVSRRGKAADCQHKRVHITGDKGDRR